MDPVSIIVGVLVKYVLKKASRQAALAVCKEYYSSLDDKRLKQARHVKKCIKILENSKEGQGREIIKQLLKEFGMESRGMDCFVQAVEWIGDLPW
jgi:hypothetical protein